MNEKINKAKATEYLFEWSENYNFPSPASLFLDLIGWSEEQYGERLCKENAPAIGYLEADLLGRALQEYANRPQEVEDWVQAWNENN